MKPTQKKPKQTKLSKQQKKIIMILGNGFKKTGHRWNRGVDRIGLKRKVSKTKNGEPMTKVAVVSVGRSLKRLQDRGIVEYGQSYLREDTWTHDRFTLTEKEGMRVYKNLKETVSLT